MLEHAEDNSDRFADQDFQGGISELRAEADALLAHLFEDPTIVRIEVTRTVNNWANSFPVLSDHFPIVKGLGNINVIIDNKVDNRYTISTRFWGKSRAHGGLDFTYSDPGSALQSRIENNGVAVTRLDASTNPVNETSRLRMINEMAGFVSKRYGNQPTR